MISRNTTFHEGLAVIRNLYHIIHSGCICRVSILTGMCYNITFFALLSTDILVCIRPLLQRLIRPLILCNNHTYVSFYHIRHLSKGQGVKVTLGFDSAKGEYY
jgi:hypothetical protein